MAAFAYMPATHSSHASALVAAGVALALPASHCDEEGGERHFVSALASPPPHLTFSQLAAPTVLYVPAAHFAQAAMPVVSPNLPATHCSHASALVAAGVALALPASHCNDEFGERHSGFALASSPPHLTCWQSATLAEPSAMLYDPAAQLVQAATPVVPLNLPAAHSLHAAALVAAGVALALPASHCDEEGGERHFVSALALSPPHLTFSQLASPTVLYVPAAQFAQAAMPVVSPNLPATHCSHASALVAAGVALACRPRTAMRKAVSDTLFPRSLRPRPISPSRSSSLRLCCTTQPRSSCKPRCR
jgi:hypothetical protein